MEEKLSLEQRLYINGEFVAVAPGEREAVINPATEEVISEAPVGSVDHVDAAVAAARKAFDAGPWPTLTPAARAVHLRRFGDALLKRRGRFEQLLMIEAGATKALANFMFDYPLRHLDFAIEMLGREHVVTFPPVHAPSLAGGSTVLTTVMERDPVGVVAAISAYNYPFSIAIFKIAAALAMGNCLILKPSPFTPFVVLALAGAAEEAELPPGVLNIVTGGAEVAAKLTTHIGVDMVSFTGSDRVGSAIAAQAAPTLKRLLLELGGKSAMIVRGDADLQKVVAAAVMNTTLHSGQGCALTTRHIVHNSIRRDYVAALRLALEAVKVGRPEDPETAMGPLIRASARDRVEHFVDEARASGAVLVTGGKRPAGLDRGYFYTPTLFDEVAPHSRLSQEEVFGPVAAVVGFDSDDEAVAIANNSPFGLSGSIFSNDVGQAYAMARRVRTGGIQVNCIPLDMTPFASMGGVKRSGIGRELGLEGLYAYTNPKCITFEAG